MRLGEKIEAAAYFWTVVWLLIFRLIGNLIDPRPRDLDENDYEVPEDER